MKHQRHQAVGLTRCPVDKCETKPAPVFCPTHWPLVTSDTKRALLAELKAMRGRGFGAVPEFLAVLLTQAVREVQRG